MRKKVSKTQIAKDREVIKAIAKLADYQPANSACSIEALLQIDATMQAAEAAAEQVHEEQIAVNLRRVQVEDVETSTGVQMHDLVLAAKNQIVAQYGTDSYVMTAIGLKRASDYKRPARKASAE